MLGNRRLFLLVGLFLLAAALLVASIARGAELTRQLSTGQAFSEVYLPSLPKISADSARVVYAQDAATNGANELWSVPLSGGAPVRLSHAMVTGQSAQFAIAADGARVVYLTDQDHLGTPELYSVPIDGGASSRISRALVASGHVLDFHLAPASGQAYYRADAVTNNIVELYRVPVAGGASTRVNRTLPTANYDVFEYAIAAQAGPVGDTERVVYRSGRSDVGGYKLWSNRSNGSPSQAVEISRDLVTGGAVGDFAISPDGTRVVYLADAIDNGRADLWSVPIAGGTSTRLDRDNGRSVKDEFSVGDLGVTYSYAPLEHYRVPVTGGVSIQVPPPLAPPVTSSDGQWQVYPIGVAELWASSATRIVEKPWASHFYRIEQPAEAGESGAERVSCPGQVVTTTFLTAPAYSISPDSRSVVYIANGNVWVSPITGAVCPLFSDGFEGGNAGAWR